MNTIYFLNQVMGNVFRSRTNPPISDQYFLALSSTEPSIDGNGVTEPERMGTGYERVEIDCFSEPVNGTIVNTDDITFPESLAPWGVMTHYAIYDAAEGGNLLIYDALTLSRIVETNTVVAIKPENLKLTLSNPAEDIDI